MSFKVKTVQQVINQTIDNETGDVIDVHVKNMQIVLSKEEFCLVYSGFWNILMDCKLSKADVELFSYLVNAYSDGTPFSITSYIKEEVAKKSKKDITSYNNSTRNLINIGLIFSVKGRVYKINPTYAFNGSSKHRRKAVFEMTTTSDDNVLLNF